MLSEAQFNAMYADYSVMLRDLLSGYEKDWDLVDDLEQEVWLQVWVSRDSYRGDSQIKTWLGGIAKNVARNYLRNDIVRSPAVTLETDMPCSGEEGEGWLDSNAVEPDNPESLAEAEDVEKFLESLPPQRKQAIEMFMDGVSYEKIAEALGTTQATARSHVRHVKAAIGY